MKTFLFHPLHLCGPARLLSQTIILVACIFTFLPLSASAAPNLKPYKPSGWTAPLQVNVQPNGITRLSWAVANLGDADTNTSFRVGVHLNDLLIATWTISSLRKGTYARVQDFAFPRTFPPGVYNLKLTADVLKNVTESSELDNDHMTTVFRSMAMPWPLPAKHTSISQGHGDTWSANTAKRHTGIDIPAPAGTVVRAVADGVVMAIGTQTGWGGYIVIGHEGNAWTTGYLHSKIKSTLKVGDGVLKGDQIGVLEALTTGPHLHFNVHGAPFGAVSSKGALPKSGGSGSDPNFAGGFIDPETIGFVCGVTQTQC